MEKSRFLNVYELYRKFGDPFGSTDHIANIVAGYIKNGGHVIWYQNELTPSEVHEKLHKALGEYPVYNSSYGKVYLQQLNCEPGFVPPLDDLRSSIRKGWDRVLIVGNVETLDIVKYLKESEFSYYEILVIMANDLSRKMYTLSGGWEFVRMHQISSNLHVLSGDDLEELIFYAHQTL